MGHGDRCFSGHRRGTVQFYSGVYELVIPLLFLGIAIETAAAIWALKRALSKSDPAFYLIFFGDALLKLAALGGITVWLYVRHLPFVGPLLTLGFGYLAASLMQIPFLYKAR